MKRWISNANFTMGRDRSFVMRIDGCVMMQNCPNRMDYIID